MILSTITNVASALPPIAAGYGGIALSAVQVVATTTNYSVANNANNGMQYSKFVHEEKPKETKMIGSRDGMKIIYTPALIVSSVMLGLPMVMDMTNIPFFPEQNLAEVFLVLHFAKRVLEVSFLHKYSGTIARDTSISIGTFYALNALMISCVAFPFADLDKNIANIGSALFAIGIAGNYYHHLLLARLRDHKLSGDSKYIAPKGGLFDYVATPHYLFELIGWLGIAVVSQQMNAYLGFAGMASYLSGRASLQNEWNRAKFSKEDWPESRKNLVPFLF